MLRHLADATASKSYLSHYWKTIYLTRHRHGGTTKFSIHHPISQDSLCSSALSFENPVPSRKNKLGSGTAIKSHDNISNLVSIRWTTAQEWRYDIHSQLRYNARRVALAKCSATRGENKMLLLELVRSSCHSHTCMIVSPAQWPVLEAAYFHKLHCQHSLQSIYKHNAKSN